MTDAARCPYCGRRDCTMRDAHERQWQESAAAYAAATARYRAAMTDTPTDPDPLTPIDPDVPADPDADDPAAPADDDL